jgi:hypothetical protein
MDVWSVSAKDGEVLSKKQDTMDAALMGPVLCKGGFAYAIALESYWLCRMPLAGECVMFMHSHIGLLSAALWLAYVRSLPCLCILGYQPPSLRWQASIAGRSSACPGY